MIQIDMEMPQNCKFCPLHDVNPGQCPIRTIYKDDYATSRFTDCPLYNEDTDTISRQQAIDSICRTVCDNPEICESPCYEVKTLINMPSAQPERRWIPCKEKLPEHSYTEQFLLTVIPNPKYSDSRIVTIGRWGAWADDKDAFDCIKPTNINGIIYNLYQPIPANQVLAWMPLPKPLEGKDEP